MANTKWHSELAFSTNDSATPCRCRGGACPRLRPCVGVRKNTPPNASWYKSAIRERSEIVAQTDFSEIRYAQCWEDADLLLEGLDVQPGDTCLSIASAGDNTLALLSKKPARVIALDVSAAQLACLELRVAAYRELTHGEVLELVGARPGSRREELYRRCRSLLSLETRRFWDTRSTQIAAGIGSAGKFERYFSHFRRYILPLVHPRSRVEQLLRGGDTQEERQAFYQQYWDTWRWRAMFRIFFSRTVLGHGGRDPRFFKYVEGRVADRLLERVRQGLTDVNPAENPYVQWILTGRHMTALPYALRPEHFDAIRENLDSLEWQRVSLEEYLNSVGRSVIDRFNLSDIFEYMSEEDYASLIEQLVHAGRPGGRLVYWNMLVPRRRPDALASRLRSLTELAQQLHQKDKACFYSAFIIEEILS